MPVPVRPKVLLAHISPRPIPSFVQKDVEILRREYTVTLFHYRSPRDIAKLTAKVATHHVVVSWFAWDNAYWSNRAAKFLGRGSVTIAGGFDVVALPEIAYGNLLDADSRQRTRAALRSAGIVLAVSRAIADDAAAVSGRKDIRLANHGFDPEKFPAPDTKKRVVLTVGALTETNLARKGISTFVKTASLLPDVPFVIAGSVDEKALKSLGSIPRNLRVLGRLSDDDLFRVMREARVYVQVSAHEGFGCSLAEAMLCGAVPVVTKRGAIPEVVGDTGIYVEYNDPEATGKAIRDALNADEASGRAARERIVRLFPLEKRREALIRAVSEVYQ